jgi:hypothetical protein
VKIISVKWKIEIESSIQQGKKIDVTSGETIALKWLVQKLTICGVPFRVYKLGLGVNRVTTDCDVCPCCGKKVTP